MSPYQVQTDSLHFHIMKGSLLKGKQIQSNLYKATTLGTTQNWSSWTGLHLIKHLYKMIAKKIWWFLASF